MPEKPDEFEEAWARIVEDLTSTPGTLDPGSEPPEPTDSHGAPGADPATDAGLAALFEPLRRAQSRPDPEPAAVEGRDDPGAFVDNWEDEGHFVPPPPPEIPTGTPIKRMAWAGLLGGPLTLALIALTGWDPPRIVSIAAGLVTLAGFATLVWLMPDAREDSGWDDGARL
jgi:hypothetical protein